MSVKDGFESPNANQARRGLQHWGPHGVNEGLVMFVALEWADGEQVDYYVNVPEAAVERGFLDKVDSRLAGLNRPCMDAMRKRLEELENELAAVRRECAARGALLDKYHITDVCDYE